MKVVRGRSLLFAAISLTFAACGPATKVTDKPVLLASNQDAMESAQTSSNRPNVVWILLDAARARNFSAYGYERNTSPNIDKLAREGVLFENAFSQATWTVPSVPSYMTGKYFPTAIHHDFNTGKTAIFRKPPLGEKLFPIIMRDNGYKTMMAVANSWWPAGSPFYNAFDETRYLKTHEIMPSGEKRYSPASFERLNTEVVFPWLENLSTQQQFFLYIHAMDTHTPHRLTAPYDKWIDPNYTSEMMGDGQPKNRFKDVHFTDSDKQHLRGLYDGDILFVDTHIGILMDRLKSLHLYDNTIVIISSDHGEYLGEDGKRWAHDWSMYDSGLHVPLIIRGPGFPYEKRVSDLVENVDIVPTLIDLLELRTDSEHDGKSLLPTISGSNQGPLHRYIFAKANSYGEPLDYCIRDFNFKYLYYEKSGQELLYQVPDEPNEAVPRRNVASEYPEVFAEMKKYAEDVYLPLWRQYDELPLASQLVSIWKDHSRAHSRDVYVTDNVGVTGAGRRDGMWSFSSGFQMLWASAQEDVSPMKLRFEVPNGTYSVQVEVLSKLEWAGEPATAFYVKCQDEEEFVKIVESKDRPADQTYVFVPLGKYTVKENTFEITLDDVEGYFAILRRIRFENASTGTTDEEDLREREEMLRGIGYLN